MQGEASYICKRAVEVFGKDTQLLMYFEEAGELAQAISKDQRGFGLSLIHILLFGVR